MVQPRDFEALRHHHLELQACSVSQIFQNCLINCLLCVLQTRNWFTSVISLTQYSASSVLCSASVVTFAVLSCLSTGCPSLKAVVGKILGKYLH